MGKHKLVPVEPTQEMINAALKSDHAEISPRKIVEQDYKAMIAAAPAVQGEPVAWRNIKEEKPEDGQDCIMKMKHGIIQGTYCSEDDTFSGYYWREMGWYATHWVPAEEAIYTAPQPAVQGEPVAWYLPSEEGYDSQFRDHATVKSCSDNPWEGWQPLYTAPQPTEQQPAPDVAGLVETLEKARDAIGSLPQDALGNVPDTQQSQGWHIRDELINDISTALAAHRKQGGES